jgi:RimJ/RimL family protein N-acetyltransferase
VTEPPTAPVTLQVGDYVLDAAVPGDADVVARALTDPDIALWNPGVQRPGTTAAERALVWIADRSAWAPDHASWVVRDRDDHVIGAVSVHHVDEGHSTAEIGYWMTPDGRGRGLGAAAVDAATRYAFEELGLVRVELFHAVSNVASCRLALRCGYLLEGTARASFVYGDGQRHDEHLHARLATDPYPEIGLPR